MVEVRAIELCLWRFIASGDDLITSQITRSHGIPSDWNVDDICDWVEGLYGDMLDHGWEFGFKFV
jgi:hypothetical protein